MGHEPKDEFIQSEEEQSGQSMAVQIAMLKDRLSLQNKQMQEQNKQMQEMRLQIAELMEQKKRRKNI